MWRPETNTFHLVAGEATITLEDVEVLTGLRTTRSPLLVSPDERPVTDICEQWMGVTPPPSAIQGKTVRVSWVKRLFDHLPDGAPAKVITFHERAYMWVLVAGVLLAGRNGDHIQVHILQLIGDPRVASTYSWGSAILAWLYKVMGRAAFFFAGSMRGTDRTHDFALDGDVLWRAVTPLLCIDCIAWQHPDRCIRQFGFDQRVPQDPEPAGHVEELLVADFRSSVTDWRAKYQQFVLHWEQRDRHIAT
ncbi:Protein MAIN-LIKE 2, partial [Linum perenne]